MGDTNDDDILCLRGGFSGRKIFSDGGRAEPTTNLFGTDVLCGARSNRTALNAFWWTCRANEENK
ncbi:hypothetical protein N9E21_01295 [Candidatus Poseidoniaceae archaeon]|nr:hypothetical protein [Candidatus Poseidoniaceae archaeon]